MHRLIETTAGDPAATDLFALQEADLLARYGGDDTGPRPPADAPTLLLEVDGGLVGCVALAVEDGIGEIKRMFVVSAARGRGLSRVLLAGVERLAAREGVELLRLVTGTEQPEAMALYASAGYDPIAGYGYWGDEPSARCCAKRLDRESLLADAG
ncbi:MULTISPECIES: GNAT family N-acetyltransferase [unclassified Rathayibacter]|uniref:GNAT family N-acetyltransferase n=1 Tax=unclassified Rathayibacter TaxID=2609250 RepID=UPI000CE8A8EC|nr:MULTISPECIES: GNAT family N-acetyltransferase [unclassified Rathayibacter]PPG02168.1 GNAT family N-acetyltransferase [Rathayibacter sp. AY2B1]PPG73933.1 GNAT family N-acetyltransferase [Rathayibacter sp. AY1F4]